MQKKLKKKLPIFNAWEMENPLEKNFVPEAQNFCYYF